jgi:hypothetical protein
MFQVKLQSTYLEQEAATIPSVYLASIYSLYHIANLKKGQVRIYYSLFRNILIFFAVCPYSLGFGWCWPLGNPASST